MDQGEGPDHPVDFLGRAPWPRDRNNGHLVVCAGFTSDGHVIICNPWADLAAGQQVKRIYDRARVVRAWASSRNTAYVIYPEPTSLRN